MTGQIKIWIPWRLPSSFTWLFRWTPAQLSGSSCSSFPLPHPFFPPQFFMWTNLLSFVITILTIWPGPPYPEYYWTFWPSRGSHSWSLPHTFPESLRWMQQAQQQSQLLRILCRWNHWGKRWARLRDLLNLEQNSSLYIKDVLLFLGVLCEVGFGLVVGICSISEICFRVHHFVF